MAADIKQEPRLLSIKTPLGPDVLILQSFAGTEKISRLFSYQLEMLSAQHSIQPAEIVGKNVTITLALADGSQRFFNGFVSQFVGGAMFTRELRRYRAEVVPWLWFLTRASDCRIFQFKTVPQIIEQVLPDLGFTDFELDVQGNHPQREYCVQYRETAFNFVSRLMEEEGIFYWFRHEDGKHTLVMADHKGAYADCPENAIDYVPGSLTEDHIGSWEHHYEYRSGKYAQTDYNFETPSTSLATSTNTLIELPNISAYELYDYPGEYRIKSDGEDLTKIRMEEQEIPYDTVRCASGCRTLHTLGKFTVTRHEWSSEENKGYLITVIEHSANDQTQLVGGGETFYQNRFTCIPDSVIFRPERVTPKPKVRGPQTAVVVGPAGEEIYTDSDGFGRVKVQYHWDRYGTHDEDSSCWMRVSQIHAGRGFGAIDIPRIGEEVIVDHLEGDPDQPIVTGRVYNAENMPPNGLPGAKMVSGMKSNSTPGGGGDNTIMLDDTKGNEKITIHGQYDMNTTVDNDQTTTVHNNRTDQIDVDDSETVGNNQTLTVGVDQTLMVGSNRTVEVGSNQSTTIGSNLTLTVGGSAVSTVGANQDASVGASQSIAVGASRTAEVGAADSLKALSITTEASTTQSLSAGATFVIEGGATVTVRGGATLTLQVGGSSITLTPASISLTSPMIKLN